MIFALEMKKLKRTGLLPAILLGGLLASVVPVLNMLVRSDVYTILPGHPLEILLNANWQMMSMLNILLFVCASCIIYHTEYADNALQRMEVLPIRPFCLFLGKCGCCLLFATFLIALEGMALTICAVHWFPDRIQVTELILDACKIMGYELALLLPTISVMLVIASVCRNMWTALGAGLILVFTASMFPTDSFWLSACPFATPYQLLYLTAREDVFWFLYICDAEILLFAVAELIYIKIRRYHS